MLKLLMWLLLGYIVFLIVRGKSVKNELPRQKPAGEVTHRDPVCGVYVAEDDAVVGRLEGERIFFCSMACLEKYQDKVPHKE